MQLSCILLVIQELQEHRVGIVWMIMVSYEFVVVH